VGWQVVNTLNDERDYEVRSVEEKLSLRQRNIEQLKTIIMDVVANPDQILEKANAAIQRIKTEHDLTSYREKLRAIYNQ
jgi:Glu-tRNA(Gln) amidotransferase subunit E-like FAD-binding protein